jgi:hypothetical protein
MPNFNGVWSSRQQLRARGASTWPALPGAPTIGTATAGNNSNATVTFTAPANAGYPTALTYIVTSSPGSITATGSASPITVTGLTAGTSYTFTVRAVNATGTGPASAASNSITANDIVAPQYVALITNSGTQAYTYNAGTATFTNVSSTYVPSGAPASAGGYEGIATTGNGTKVISTGWNSPLRCATFTLSTTPWTMTSQGSLPIGSSGNALGGWPSINSRGTFVMVSSGASGGVYYSSATGNSWTSMAVGASSYRRTAAGHNRFYIANGDTDLRCYDGTGAPSFLSSINCGSSNKMDASERTYDPNSYTNPPTNEIIVVSGLTSAIVLYTASTNSYSVLRRGSVSDGLPETFSAAVTRDGTRAVFATATRAYIYNINPTAGTASLFTDFAISGASGNSNCVGIFPNGGAIVVSNNPSMRVYNMSGAVVSTTSIPSTAYGLTCVYNGVNYS